MTNPKRGKSGIYLYLIGHVGGGVSKIQMTIDKWREDNLRLLPVDSERKETTTV